MPMFKTVTADIKTVSTKETKAICKKCGKNLNSDQEHTCDSGQGKTNRVYSQPDN